MQTFIPFPTFEESLKVLDNKRLGKQRVECLQILNVLTESRDGWRKHPATIMWRGAIPALIEYTLTCCDLWVARGFKDSIANKIYDKFSTYLLDSTIIIPKWCSDARVNDSHKAMLFHKDPQFYKQFADFQHIKDYYWHDSITEAALRFKE